MLQLPLIWLLNVYLIDNQYISDYFSIHTKEIKEIHIMCLLFQLSQNNGVSQSHLPPVPGASPPPDDMYKETLQEIGKICIHYIYVFS